MKKTKGAAATEAILITFLLFTLFQLLVNGLKKVDIDRPATYLKAMTRSGVWTWKPHPTDFHMHPNRWYRAVSTKGKGLEKNRRTNP